jgi:4-cresol dehydrogenase (hydroxylating)
VDGLFAQSNYGIVTAAGMELLPRHEAHTAMVAKINDEARFVEFVQVLTDLRKREILRTAVHIGNRARTVSTLGPLVHEQLARDETLAGQDLRALTQTLIASEGFGPWSAVGGIDGSRAELASLKRTIRMDLSGIARVVFLDDAKIVSARRLVERLSGFAYFRRKRVMLNAVEPLYGLSKGVPTDQPLKSVYWLAGDTAPPGELNPDAGRAGFLYCLPMIPMSGRDAARAAAETKAIFGRAGFESYITLNMVNSKVLEGVINLAFDRGDPSRVEAAHGAIDALQNRFLELGYIPYRLGIQSMASVIRDDDPFWRLARDLKQVFDPNHIIAPGRYNLV